MTTTTRPTPVRTALCGALAAVLALGPAAVAAAEEPGGWKGEGGLTLTSGENNTVDAYVERAREAEHSISVQVRAAAAMSEAEVVGFDQRLKSPDSLKRKVATALAEQPGRNVDTVLAQHHRRRALHPPVGRRRLHLRRRHRRRHARYWRNESVKWSNTWGRTSGYKGLNTGWRAPRSGQLFEVQFHTEASKNAQETTHKLYEEQRLPSTGPERKQQLQREQDAIFAAVPVPARRRLPDRPGTRAQPRTGRGVAARPRAAAAPAGRMRCASRPEVPGSRGAGPHDGRSPAPRKGMPPMSGFRGQAAYAAASHGVIGFTRSAALDHAAEGIRVNAVCPGIVDTEMIRRFGETRPGGRDGLIADEP
ncbi:SDR family NAD(P)-dependent oxidoreductase [Actinomadura keratinilytica]